MQADQVVYLLYLFIAAAIVYLLCLCIAAAMEKAV